MSVKKIFMMLITVVACVMIGAFVLNILMPNFITTAVNLVEQQLHNATGMTLDLNGDGTYQTGNKGKYNADANEGANGNNVTGFTGGGAAGVGGGSAD